MIAVWFGKETKEEKLAGQAIAAAVSASAILGEDAEQWCVWITGTRGK